MYIFHTTIEIDAFGFNMVILELRIDISEEVKAMQQLRLMMNQTFTWVNFLTQESSIEAIFWYWYAHLLSLRQATTKQILNLGPTHSTILIRLRILQKEDYCHNCLHNHPTTRQPHHTTILAPQ